MLRAGYSDDAAEKCTLVEATLYVLDEVNPQETFGRL